MSDTIQKYKELCDDRLYEVGCAHVIDKASGSIVTMSTAGNI